MRSVSGFAWLVMRYDGSALGSITGLGLDGHLLRDVKALFVLLYSFRFDAYQTALELCCRFRLDTYVPTGKINAVQAMLVINLLHMPVAALNQSKRLANYIILHLLCLHCSIYPSSSSFPNAIPCRLCTPLTVIFCLPSPRIHLSR